MISDRVKEISSLLTQAGMAHHEYEQNILKGVYDRDWASWYANYVLTNGFDRLLNASLTVEQLTQLLVQTNSQYEAETPTQSWSDYTAEKICSSLIIGY
ncbi:MAG: hypothetical protein MUD14_23845 [Hydrococcus sp. Prado102]|jgi:hypothetical protein|nr:hypothetical protein [Hydrococcus sp. Prado102]